METMNATGELAALIQAAIDRGESTRGIAERAHRGGHKLSHAQVNNLQRGLVRKAPDPDMIRALAAGLGISEQTIQRAVFRDWYGYDVVGGEEYAGLIPDNLPPAERLELERMVRAWLRAKELDS